MQVHLRRMIAASLHMSDDQKLVRKLRKRSTFSGKSATILAASPALLYASSLFQTHVHFAILARTRTRAHPAILCFYLHLFTGRAQLICAQRNKGEGFCPSTFTLRFTRERESAMPPLLLRNMHKCRPQIAYSREGTGEDPGEGERPFLRKTFTPNSLIHCKM